MLDILRDKKVIFFDVGYTLDAPASGDWMFTNRFLELAGDKLKQRTETEIQQAREAGLRSLSQNHVIQTVEAEIRNFFDYYSMISDRLDLGLSEKERDQIARDRACNMKNYIPYPGIVEVLSTLSTTHKLGIISDTWPSIMPQLEYIKRHLKITMISGMSISAMYIRVAGTTRPASSEKIWELEMEGARISWDELICTGYPVMESAIRKLCRDMNRYRREMQERRGSTEKLATVTRSNLENWNVLKKGPDGYFASNAFVLLTGSYFRYSKTQCAVFAGTDRGEFIDKQDYTGPLYEQIESAYAFVLRNIRRSARVEGLIRKESHELPPNAIREMIINAHCHRNFLDESCVQVALYDDRLEVTSPGGLCYGLTLEEALNGRSRQRNRAVAEIFNQMGLIEAWGNGLKSIRREAKAYDLPEPEFVEMPETFRVNLFRKPLPIPDRDNIGRTSEEHRKNIGNSSVESNSIVDFCLNSTQQKILELLSEQPHLTAAVLSQRIGIAQRNIEANIRKLKEIGILVHHGSTKSGYWEVIKHRSC